MAQTLVSPAILFPSQPIGGGYSVSLADQGAAGTETDTARANCKFIRGYMVIKSGMANTNTFNFRVQVDNNVSQASPEIVFQSPVYTFNTGVDKITMLFQGISFTGFQYFKIIGTDSGGTAVYDAYVECW